MTAKPPRAPGEKTELGWIEADRTGAEIPTLTSLLNRRRSQKNPTHPPVREDRTRMMGGPPPPNREMTRVLQSIKPRVIPASRRALDGPGRESLPTSPPITVWDSSSGMRWPTNTPPVFQDNLRAQVEALEHNMLGFLVFDTPAKAGQAFKVLALGNCEAEGGLSSLVCFGFQVVPGFVPDFWREILQAGRAEAKGADREVLLEALGARRTLSVSGVRLGSQAKVEGIVVFLSKDSLLKVMTQKGLFDPDRGGLTGLTVAMSPGTNSLKNAA